MLAHSGTKGLLALDTALRCRAAVVVVVGVEEAADEVGEGLFSLAGFGLFIAFLIFPGFNNVRIVFKEIVFLDEAWVAVDDAG